ncbi:Pentapeptide repeat protein [Sinomonas atrocyanea]|uniref:Pentapeptide repeat protein n=1 Tax=Sinomonas atrocyanea TaxID=37927 RepID=A0A126ZVA2_9MICC|nr:pentapeptide repeat-containing protein [Sinomonas atrocyanea]AMM31013.1 Pentapeptide repeat protein [Sinomonas atrocyanea]GEB63260.1 hypothetical protein SAT01_07080 [Sinomonas atrocyanea]GGG69597.1 hypothetical protein GCM10007172_22170 [Sinomonas atrocyanea]
MTKPAVVALLTNSQVWNAYLKRLPQDQRPDLAGAKLAGAALDYRDLSRANLVGADLSRANLAKTLLIDADLRGANLADANLAGAMLNDANLTGADLTGANLTAADLIGADLTEADFDHARLTGATMIEANLVGAALTAANLRRVNLTGAHLMNADLTRAQLYNAKLNGAILTSATLNRANLTNADLTEADLTSAKIDLNTVNAAGETLLRALQSSSSKKLADLDVVRLVVELPENSDPQTLADLASSAAIVARLSMQVGAQLQHERLPELSSESVGPLLTTATGQPSFVTVRSMHYGSPWWIDLVEQVPSYVQLGGAIAGTAAIVGRKHNRQLLSFLFMLARRQERELWLEERREYRRAELGRQRVEHEHQIAEHEKERANAAAEMERRTMSEASVASLRIEPASEAELRQRVASAGLKPELTAKILEDSAGLEPLVRNGLNVVTAEEDQRG